MPTKTARKTSAPPDALPEQHRLLIQLFSGDAPADAPVPTEFRIFRAGSNPTTKGTLIFSEKSQRDVMEASADYGNEVCLDYGHSMFAFISGADPAEQNKAAGWCTLDVRAGELWAKDVSFTPLATQKLKNREYRYVSPAVLHAEDGTVSAVLNIALTNIPATKNMTPLVASRSTEDETLEEPQTMDPKLLALLSLAANATVADAAIAIEKLAASEKGLLEVCSAKNSSEALGKVQAWKLASEQLHATQEKLLSIETAGRKSAVDALIDGAVKDGKFGKGQVELLAQMGVADPERLKAFIAASPKAIPVAEVQPGTATAGVAGLSKDELTTASAFGNDPKKVAEMKARIEAAA